MGQSKSIHKKKLKPPPKYDYRAGNHSIKKMVPQNGKISLKKSHPNKILINGKKVDLNQRNKNLGL